MYRIFLFIILLTFLFGCKSAKDVLTLKKKNNADEFLVEKKNPLVLPPEYGKLPLPSGKKLTGNGNQEGEVQSIIDNKSISPSTKIEKNKEPTSVEQSILEKIK